jgi:type II secretory pathway pseudopilin PulG
MGDFLHQFFYQESLFMQRLHRYPSLFKTSEQGFSLVEAMVGFTIASALLAALAPFLLMTISTRVQNYRAKQAMELAQSQINRIQTLMTQGVPQNQELGKIPPPAPKGVKVAQIGPPTILVTDPAYLDSPTKALEIDYDNDQNPEFIVQMFRDEGVRFDQYSVAQDQLAVFQVGIRVYAGAAKDNLGSLETPLASLNLIQGFGQQKFRPLAVLYTEVSRSDLKPSLQIYADYLK